MGIAMVLRIGRTELVAMEALKSVFWAVAGYSGRCTGTPGDLTRIILNEALVQLPQLLPSDVPCGVIG